MSRSSESDDFWGRFEKAMREGQSAIEYWSNREDRNRKSSDLVDLLLMEFESRGADLSTLPEMVEHVDTLENSRELVSGAYELSVAYGQKPHVSEVNGLAQRNWQWLRLVRDPFYIGQHVAGRYGIEQRLGNGTFGVVYKLHDRLLDRCIAAKVPHLANTAHRVRVQRRQLSTEFLAMGSLGGRGSPHCYEIEKHDEIEFLIMDFVPGCSLRELLRDGPIGPVESSRILARVARTVGLAHSLGYIHRDLKPENILIDECGEPYVVDFGLIAKIPFADESAPKLSGTKQYMPPEDLAADACRIDPRTDIYAIGIVLHEMLTGKRPTCSQAAKPSPADSVETCWASDTPLQLQRIGDWCLAPQEVRLDDAHKLAGMLEGFASNPRERFIARTAR